MRSDATRVRFWALLLLPASISIAQLSLLWRTAGAGNFFVINTLTWLSFFSLWFDLLDHLPNCRWRPYAWPSLLILAWVLMILSRPHTIYDSLLNSVPFATFLALATLLEGSPFISLCVLGLLPAFQYFASILLPISLLARLTASLSSSILWLSGTPAISQVDQIRLGTHSLVVGPGCTGVNALSLCMATAIALAILNGALSWKRTTVLFFGGFLIAFFVNACRVVVLAHMPVEQTVNGLAESPAFTFWHTGQGSTLFAFIAVTLVLVFESWLRRLEVPRF